MKLRKLSTWKYYLGLSFFVLMVSVTSNVWADEQTGSEEKGPQSECTGTCDGTDTCCNY